VAKMDNKERINLKDLFVSSLPFTGFPTSFEAADYVVFGVPFDHTTSYLPGSRFAPDEIRKASINIETYYIDFDIAVEEIPIHDLGNLALSTAGNVNEMIDKVSFVVSELTKLNKIPVILGGEHLLTLGAVRGLKSTYGDEFALVHFDAHFDLHDIFDNHKLNHATVMRRILDELDSANLIQIGIRAPSRDEYEFVKEKRIKCIYSSAFQNYFDRAIDILKSYLGVFDSVYITFDVDVFEPAFAPGVANPEPGGLTYHQLSSIIDILTSKAKVIGLDVVEVNPLIERYVTPIYAAKIIYDVIVRSYIRLP